MTHFDAQRFENSFANTPYPGYLPDRKVAYEFHDCVSSKRKVILAVRFVLGRSEKLQLHRVQYNLHTLSEQIFQGRRSAEAYLFNDDAYLG